MAEFREFRIFLRTSLELILRGKSEYQIGNSIQKLDGPCIRSLELIGQFSVTACSRIGDRTFIIQGVSMPKEFKTNHFLFGRLEQNAKNIPKHISAEANQSIQSNRILANVGKVKLFLNFFNFKARVLSSKIFWNHKML